MPDQIHTSLTPNRETDFTQLLNPSVKIAQDCIHAISSLPTDNSINWFKEQEAQNLKGILENCETKEQKRQAYSESSERTARVCINNKKWDSITTLGKIVGIGIPTGGALILTRKIIIDYLNNNSQNHNNKK